MRILHIGTLDVKTGGPAFSMYLTIKGLNKIGCHTEIIIMPLGKDDKLIGDDIRIHYTKKPFCNRFGLINGLSESIKKCGDFDLYHLPGLWQYWEHVMAKYARENNKPYIISPRGSLYPQALKHSKTIKKISLLLYQDDDLRKATCIHATCIEEKDFYRKLGYTNPVAVIPNPIDTHMYMNLPIEKKPKRRIGYLGRLHERKRIERLIYAFSNLGSLASNCELVIIGSDDKEYENFLRKEVRRLKLSNVVFTGFLVGSDKDKALESLSYLVIPSDFENFGNVVVEALVRGIPVVASKGTPWQELHTYNCGWWVDNDQKTLNNVLHDIINQLESERIEMGIQGRKLMIEKYSVEVICNKMKLLYSWILGYSNKPDFIYESTLKNGSCF